MLKPICLQLKQNDVSPPGFLRSFYIEQKKKYVKDIGLRLLLLTNVLLCLNGGGSD